MKQKNNHKKQHVVDDIVYSYSSEWIHRLETEEHWRLYWQQARMLENVLQPEEKVLEIGVGSGFLANYLRSRGMAVKTLDIDEEKKPDIQANIVTFEWHDYHFDHILAFEVFEHIPFEKFLGILPAMLASCKKTMTLSVPLNEYVLLRADVRLPLCGRFGINITFPKLHIDEENHFWEIGFLQVSDKDLLKAFREQGFTLTKRAKKFSRLFLQFARQ